jgi:predicted cobalt transporter CbtA
MSLGFVVVICFFLLQRVRWLWIATMVFTALGVVLGLVEGNARWYTPILAVVGLVLLLLPETRRFFQRAETPAAT